MKARKYEKSPIPLPFLAMGLGAVSILLSAFSPASERTSLTHSQDTAQALYEENCGVCHQVDGSGVPFMQPELIESPRANGDKGQVIQMILKGSKAVASGTSEFENEMPGFDYLTNEQIALIATYVRTNFDNQGGTVSPDDVARERERN